MIWTFPSFRPPPPPPLLMIRQTLSVSGVGRDRTRVVRVVLASICFVLLADTAARPFTTCDNTHAPYGLVHKTVRDGNDDAVNQGHYQVAVRWTLWLLSCIQRSTNTQLMWSYIALLLAFMTALYIVENVCEIFRRAPRQLSLSDDYVGAEPCKVGIKAAFEYDTPMTFYERAKFVFFFGTGIALVRFLMFTISMLIAFGVLYFSGWYDRRTHPRYFSFFFALGTLVCQFVLAAIGIYNVDVYGTFSEHETNLVISNHSCVVEALLVFLLATAPSFVSRKENNKVPCFAGATRACGVIIVDRSATDSRKQSIDAIQTRVKDSTATRLMIFPEGTTSSQRALFMFKKGAFECGVPVQMVCVYFPYKYFNPCWTGRNVGGNNILDIVLRLLSQFVMRAEVRILPVYYPTMEEKCNAVLYASHAQKMMACVLGENISDAKYSDYKIVEKMLNPTASHTNQMNER